MKKILTALLLSVLTISGAQAEGFYLGGFYYETDYSEDIDFLNEKFAADTSGLGIKVGYDFFDYLGTEFRYMADLQEGDDNLVNGTIDGSVEFEQAMGLYLKGGLPIPFGENAFMKVYAIAGMTWADVSFAVSGNGISQSDEESESDFGYGAGLEFNLGKAGFLNLEYMDMYDKDSIEVEMLSIGLNFYL